ncbi:MAG: NAD(P)/FAD-dependent oxidoreductase [Comamonadaceae bacterium]|nr:NAD(P)/FAD-dependent oxidoreductase [Comamonadaceae bacterium]
MAQTVVIVGAGHAAVQAVDTLRREGHTGPIVLVGDEPYLPYNRPPLSKKFLSGELERERLLAAQRRSSTSSTGSRRGSACGSPRSTAPTGACASSDGSELIYDKLLLCVGSRPRLLEVPGHDLRRHPHACARSPTSTRSAPTSPAPGGSWWSAAGYIGLEAAACARHLGLEVTVLEMADRADDARGGARSLGVLHAPARARGRAHPLQHAR